MTSNFNRDKGGSTPKPKKAPQEPQEPEDLAQDQSVWSFFSYITPDLNNPGKFEHLDDHAKDILETRENFDGFRMDYTRQVSSSFGLSHLISFGSTSEQANYSLQATYYKRGLHLSARLYPSTFTVQGRAVKSWTQACKTKNNKRYNRSLTLKMTAKASNQPDGSQATFEGDCKLKDGTYQIKLHAPSTVEVSFVQSITKTVAAGMHAFYDHILGKSEWITALKYKLGKAVWTASYGSFGHLTFGYSQKMANKTWATEMQFLRPEGQDVWESVWTVGYQYELTTSTLKGRFDSNWKLSALLEEKMNPLISFLFCGDMDYLKDTYRIGFGVSIHA